MTERERLLKLIEKLPADIIHDLLVHAYAVAPLSISINFNQEHQK